jgi:hypothetical protein
MEARSIRNISLLNIDIRIIEIEKKNVKWRRYPTSAAPIPPVGFFLRQEIALP